MRWIVLIFYLALILLLLLGSIILILFISRCPHKAKLDWYQKDIIYEMDLKMFRDSNQDGIGDIQGLEEKLDYLEKNLIQSILFRSSIFNSTDLLTFDQRIINQTDLQNFIKLLNRKSLIHSVFYFEFNSFI